jgi:ARG and Rhodanese-Phosphatase-superfamily-associated Protein domain
MSNPARLSFLGSTLLVTALIAGFALHVKDVRAAAGPMEQPHSSYRVLAPIESGNLLLFPVVQSGKTPASPFLTLDEGIKSGQVEVTEAGKVRGLVRPRPAQGRIDDGVLRPIPNPPQYRGDQVNTLVLVNNSDKPLLLLAGEIVTGGKQDRVIAKDRIVPAGNDPIDLGVFCIEPGRWTEDTATFRGSAKAPTQSMMVQPSVRAKAMVEKDQQEVWNSVHGSIAAALAAPVSPPPGVAVAQQAHAVPDANSLGTTSYARAMQSIAVSEKVDEAAAPVMKSREQVLEKLRAEHAVGVVVAVRGEIVWADIFSDGDLLARYWTKLVRSYAAESLLGGETRAVPGVADAQRFLDAPRGGTETSIGDVGVYRYKELRSGGTETFVLESLLPGTEYDVHISKLKLRGEVRRVGSPMGLR